MAMRKMIEMMTMMTTIGPMIMTMIMPETNTTMKNMRMRKMMIMMTTMITRGRPDDMSVWWEERGDPEGNLSGNNAAALPFANKR